METYTTLASRTSPTLMPLTRDADGSITAFVFPNADAAIAYANSYLQHYNDEWIAETHDRESMLAWLVSCESEDNVTLIAANPDGENPRLMPLALFRAVVGNAP